MASTRAPSALNCWVGSPAAPPPFLSRKLTALLPMGVGVCHNVAISVQSAPETQLCWCWAEPSVDQHVIPQVLLWSMSPLVLAEKAKAAGKKSKRRWIHWLMVCRLQLRLWQALVPEEVKWSQSPSICLCLGIWCQDNAIYLSQVPSLKSFVSLRICNH